jgi:hypothetical protein
MLSEDSQQLQNSRILAELIACHLTEITVEKIPVPSFPHPPIPALLPFLVLLISVSPLLTTFPPPRVSLFSSCSPSVIF